MGGRSSTGTTTTLMEWNWVVAGLSLALMAAATASASLPVKSGLEATYLSSADLPTEPSMSDKDFPGERGSC